MFARVLALVLIKRDKENLLDFSLAARTGKQALENQRCRGIENVGFPRLRIEDDRLVVEEQHLDFRRKTVDVRCPMRLRPTGHMSGDFRDVAPQSFFLRKEPQQLLVTA